MKNFIGILENIFEKITGVVLQILGHSITFIAALGVVGFFLSNQEFYHQSLHNSIRDVILSITFLSFFIIQKAFNHFSKSLHVKLNELVASQDKASNRLVNAEQLSEKELTTLTKHYTHLAEKVNETENKNISQSIEHVIGDEEKTEGE